MSGNYHSKLHQIVDYDTYSKSFKIINDHNSILDNTYNVFTNRSDTSRLTNNRNPVPVNFNSRDPTDRDNYKIDNKEPFFG